MKIRNEEQTLLNRLIELPPMSPREIEELHFNSLCDKQKRVALQALILKGKLRVNDRLKIEVV